MPESVGPAELASKEYRMPTLVPVRGSKYSLLPGSRAIGPVNFDEIATLTIRTRSVGVPNDLIEMAYDLAAMPLSKRRYLTHEDLAKKYGSRKDDLDQLEHFAQTHNLIVVRRSAGERSLILRGRLKDLLGAFPANVRLYDHPGGPYRGRVGEIQVPEELSEIITGIFGYDTRPRHRTPHRAKYATFNGPGSVAGQPSTYFAERYNFPIETSDGVSLNGSGQTVALIELGGGYRNSDLQAYFSEISSPLPNVVSVSVDGAINSPSNANSADAEVMLDIGSSWRGSTKSEYRDLFFYQFWEQGFYRRY